MRQVPRDVPLGFEVDSVIVAIGLGSNVPSKAGSPAQTLSAATEALRHLPGTRVVAISRFHETAPVGPVPQPAYVNACAAIETTLSPRQLLDALLLIERGLGRDRSREQRWGPRTLDLDIILYGDKIIQEPGLHIPHPRMHERLFVLEPLSEVLPLAVHPGLQQTITSLLASARSASEQAR